MPRREHDARHSRPRARRRRRTSRPRRPCSARCCSRRPRSARSPRSSTRPTSTAARTARSTGRALALWGKGEPVDAITLANELEERGELERDRRRRAHRRARGARPGDRERRALRAHRQGDGDAARPRSRPARRSCGSGRSGSGRRPTSSTAPSRSSSTSPSSGSRATSPRSRPLLTESFERITQLYEAGRRRHRDPVRVPRPRPAHLRLPARQPRHPRRATVDGEVGARALHGREPRRPRTQTPVALFTLEMSKAEVTQRLMCSEAKVESQRLRSGQARRRTTGRGSPRPATS